MMPRARLTIVAAAGELEELVNRFAEGAVDVMVELVCVEADGELLRHDLRPLDVTGVSSFATTDQLPDERTGPLVRVYATHPGEEA